MTDNHILRVSINVYNDTSMIHNYMKADDYKFIATKVPPSGE